MLSTMMAGLAALSPTLEGLRATPVVRASDAATVALPNLWRANTPFRVNTEAAASLKPAASCVYLRLTSLALTTSHPPIFVLQIADEVSVCAFLRHFG